MNVLLQMPKLPQEIIDAGLNGQLVLFVGAGISMLRDLPSWSGFARDVLSELREQEFINYSEFEQLCTLSNPRTQLSIAKLIAEENKYNLDLAKRFRAAPASAGIYAHLNSIGCPCVTTNYDELLCPQYSESKDGSKTSRPPNRIFDKKEFYARHLDEPGVVLHIHGSVSNPDGMVVTTKEYLEHYDDDNVKHFLGELFSKKTVLFLGYGLEETEILEHILRRGSAKPTPDRRRFALQGFFGSNQPLYQRLSDYYKASFGVHLLGFTRDQENYQQQDSIIQIWVPQIAYKPPALVDDLARMDEVLRG